MLSLTRIPPTIGRIMAITAGFFLLQLLVRALTGLPWVEGLGALVLQDPDGVPYWQFWRLGTYALLHYDISHLLFNMLGLWLIGATLEETLGSRRLLTIYILSVVCGGLSALICAALGLGGTAQVMTLMGASAGTMGILFTFIALSPQSTVHLWMLIIIPIKALYLGIGIIAWQLVGLALGHGSTTSYSAHLGGILLGLGAAYTLRRGWDRRASSWTQNMAKRWKRRHIKVVK